MSNPDKPSSKFLLILQLGNACQFLKLEGLVNQILELLQEVIGLKLVVLQGLFFCLRLVFFELLVLLL